MGQVRSNSRAGGSKKEDFVPVCRGENIAHGPAQIFTFRELAVATKNLRRDCLFGESGFGRVYKGRMENGQDRMYAAPGSWMVQKSTHCLLSIAVDHICKDDLHLIGKLPTLASFDLSIAAPAEKIIITPCAGFPRLNRFEFTCDMLSYLIFETGAMPSLRALYLASHVARWDGIIPVGMEHLSRLQEITLQNSGNIDVDKEEATAVNSAFRDAIEAHPSRPIITPAYPFLLNLRELLPFPEADEQRTAVCIFMPHELRGGRNLNSGSGGPIMFS